MLTNDDKAKLEKLARLMQAELGNMPPYVKPAKPKPRRRSIMVLAIGLSALIVFGPVLAALLLDLPYIAALWLLVWMIERYVQTILGLDWSK